MKMCMYRDEMSKQYPIDYALSSFQIICTQERQIEKEMENGREKFFRDVFHWGIQFVV